MSIKGNFGLALAAVSLIAIFSCKVESDQVPHASIIIAPEIEQKSRLEIKSVLTQLTASTALLSRVQNVLQRGLKEQDSVSGPISPAKPLNILEPSEADTLSFSSERPEAFEYRLNNSAGLSLQTRSGGQLSFTLSGTVNQNGERVDIIDAKLDVLFVSQTGEQKFHILTQSHRDVNGEYGTDWSIDFSQLNALNEAAVGEAETAANISGVLTVHVSKSRTDVSATSFRQVSGDMVIFFDTLEIHMTNESSQLTEAKVSGRVERGGNQVGEFSIIKATGQGVGEFHLSLNLR